MISQPGIMTDEQQSRLAGLDRADEQIHEVLPRIRIQRRGWFVTDDERRITEQGSGDGHPLLLAYRQRTRGTARQRLIETQLAKQPKRLFFRRTLHPGTTFGSKRQRQQHVIQHTEVRHQIELLENVANVGATNPVSKTRPHFRGVLTSDSNETRRRLMNARNQSKQRGFATATRTMQKDPLTSRQLEMIYIEQARPIRPAKLHAGEAQYGIRCQLSVHQGAGF